MICFNSVIRCCFRDLWLCLICSFVFDCWLGLLLVVFSCLLCCMLCLLLVFYLKLVLYLVFLILFDCYDLIVVGLVFAAFICCCF